MQSTVSAAIENNQLDFPLAADLMQLASSEMIGVDSVPDIQLPSSDILVAVGTVYCKDVIHLLGSTLVDKPNAVITFFYNIFLLFQYKWLILIFRFRIRIYWSAYRHWFC